MACRTADFLLCRSLRSPQTPPFIGLATIEENHRRSALEKSRAYLDGDHGRIAGLFREFPYASAWCVAQALSEAYGEDGNAIYKHIERALGVSLDHQSTRSTLYEGFGRVCEKLGLPTRGFNRMVDVYLLHAGVPLAFLPTLIRAFLRQEAAFGPPPTHATAMLNRWEDDSLEFLPPALATLPRAISWDETAWHAALFARIRRDPKAFVAQHPFEERFSQALSDLQASGGPVPVDRSGAASVASPKPRLIWHGDGLALRLPRVDGRIQLWQDEDRSPFRLRGGEDWMLPQPWPARLRWSLGEHSGGMNFLSTPDGLTVFDRTTGHVAMEIEPGSNEVVVDTSDAVILSRSQFSVGDEPALESGDSGFIAFARLGPSPTDLANKGGMTRLRARPRRRLNVRGDRVAGGPRGPLYGPSAVVEVETGLGRCETRHLRITVERETADVEVVVIEGFAEIGVSALLSSLPATIRPDPLQVRVDLLAPSDGAASARSSGISMELWVWPAFSEIDGLVFESDPGPQNLALEHSRHVVADSRRRLALDSAGGYVAARAVFEIGGRFVPFDLPWPDVVVIMRRPDGSEIGLPTGTRLTVGEENRFDTVAVRCPDPLADLFVCGRHERFPFARGLSRNIAVRNLLEPASDNKVVLRRASGTKLLLFELVPSMAPATVRFLPSRHGFRVCLNLVGPVDALALEVQHEQGATEFVEASLGRRPVSTRRPSWLRAELPNGDPTEVELTVSTSEFEDGLALARIFLRPDVRLEDQSTWRPLRNARGDTYAIVLGSPGLGAPDTNLRRRFDNLSRWLADCHAAECWSEFERLLMSRWKLVGRALSDRPGGLGAIVMAAAVPPPDHAARSWIPMAHPLGFLPGLYGSATDAFAGLAGSSDPGVAELARLFSIGRLRLRDQPQLHSTVYLAFRNRVEATQRDVSLVGFEPRRLFANLPMVDSDPSAGWFWRGATVLGPDHWRAAHMRFVERLEVAEMFMGEEADAGRNSWREVALQRLVRVAWEMTDEAARPPVPLRSADREEPDSVDLWAATALSEFGRASRMGKVDDLVTKLGGRLDWPAAEVLKTLGLLLRLAPELFAFFLITWQIARERP